MLFLGAQFLWGALLFVPGAQAYRPIIRALPYALSAGLFVVYVMRVVRGRSPRGSVLLTFALGLLAANLMHPTSQIGAGVAQCIFQATIAAPMFWGWKAVDSAAQLRRLLVITFVFNTIGAALGVLQVYFPKQFMPPELSSLGSRMNDMYIESLTYVGADGERIIRPPGLSDQPGGAATAGALTVVLGAGLSIGASTNIGRALTLGAAAVGLAAIYLTQVRSLLLMSVGALAVMAVMLFRRGQVVVAGRIALSAGVLVIVAFFWARSLGGESVQERFIGITQQGAMRTYQENRGGFVSDTFGDLLDKYPLGRRPGSVGHDADLLCQSRQSGIRADLCRDSADGMVARRRRPDVGALRGRGPDVASGGISTLRAKAATRTCQPGAHRLLRPGAGCGVRLGRPRLQHPARHPLLVPGQLPARRRTR